MTRPDSLGRGRESLERKAWGDAYDQLTAADHEAPLEPEDLERRATAAYLFGKDADDIWAANRDLIASEVAALKPESVKRLVDAVVDLLRAGG